MNFCPKISNNGQFKYNLNLESVPIVPCTTLPKRYWTKWTFVPNFQIMDKPNIIELESVPIVPCNNTAKKVLDKKWTLSQISKQWTIQIQLNLRVDISNWSNFNCPKFLFFFWILSNSNIEDCFIKNVSLRFVMFFLFYVVKKSHIYHVINQSIMKKIMCEISRTWFTSGTKCLRTYFFFY